jgi:hypothetical protein
MGKGIYCPKMPTNPCLGPMVTGRMYRLGRRVAALPCEKADVSLLERVAENSLGQCALNKVLGAFVSFYERCFFWS